MVEETIRVVVARLDERTKGMASDIGEIKSLVIVQNGRIRTLEDCQAEQRGAAKAGTAGGIAGGFAFALQLVQLVLPHIGK